MTKPSLTVYSASAGSGKTFTLAAYYIAQVLRNDVPDDEFKHILAVTFTVKATGEMKDRILGTLYNIACICNEGMPSMESIPGDTLSYLNKIAEIEQGRPYSWAQIVQRSLKADRVLKEILHNYDRFRVTTIDSFFQSVLKGLARELGLSAGFRTELNNADVRKLAVERIMDSLADKDKKQVRKQLESFIKDNLVQDQKWSVVRPLEEFSEWLFKEGFIRHQEDIRSMFADRESFKKALDKILEKKMSLAKELEQIYKDFVTGSESWPVNDKAFVVKPAKDSSLKKMQQWLLPLKKLGEPKVEERYAGYLVPDDGSGLLRDANDSANLPVAKKALDLYRDTVSKYMETKLEYNTAALAMENLHQLGMLNEIDKEVNQINAENDQFIIANTGALLSQLMNSDGNNVFIYDKIGPYLHHVMIDEFQDTSSLQWRNFLPLIQEMVSSSQDCLVVGDIKQSLYRWRNGDWKVLYNIDNEADFQKGTVEKKPLEENYRSDKVIIDFNNRVFGVPEMVEDADGNQHPKYSTLPIEMDCLLGQEPGRGIASGIYQGAEQKQPAHKKDKPANGYVRATFYTSNVKRKGHMLGDLTNQVARLHEQGVPYGSMAIILRKKKNTPLIIEAFKSNPATQSVKLVSSDAYQFHSSWAILAVIATLRLLLDTENKLYRTYLLPLFNDDEDAMNAFIQEMGLHKNLPLVQLNEKIVEALKLGQYKDQSEFVMAYFDAVAEFVKNNPADIHSLLNYWEDSLHTKAITSTDKNALQIVTIHASKGLAFDHVFMPYCDFDVFSFSHSDVHWLPTRDKGNPYEEIPVIPVDFKSHEMVENSLFAPSIQEEKEQMAVDNMNLLYVGFTRAKSSLYIWGSRQKGSIAEQLYKVVGNTDAVVDRTDVYETYTFGNEEREFPSAKEEKGTRMEPLFAHKTEVGIGEQTYEPEFRQSTESKRMVGDNPEDGKSVITGIQIHNIFSYIDSSNDIDKAISQYESADVVEEETSQLARKLFSKGLQNPVIAEWFSEGWEVLNEQSILVPDEIQGRTIRPDRIMVRGQEVVVVDFKFAFEKYVRHNEKQHLDYVEQVQGYMKALQMLMPQSTIKGYIWYLRDSKIESIEVE